MAKMFYTTDEAAQKLGVSGDQLKQLVTDSKLREFRDGARVMFKVDQVDKLFSDRKGQQGFRKIFAGPEHEPYGAFCVAGGHQIGFNDLKTIEVRDFLLAIAGQETGHADFREGYEVQKVLETIYASAAERQCKRV